MIYLEVVVIRCRSLFLLWLRDTLLCIANTLASVNVLQALLLKADVSAGKISLLVSFTQGAYLLFSVLFSNAASRFQSVRKPTGLLYWAQGGFFALYAVLCMFPDAPLLICILAYLFSFFANVAGTVRDIFNYRFVIEVIPAEDYSLYSAVSGIFSGVFGILPGIAVNFLYGIRGYYLVTAGAFLAAGIAAFGAGCVNIALCPLPKKEADTLAPASHPQSAVREIFARSEFCRLIAANLIRGFGAGIVALLPVLAVRYVGFSEEKTVLLTSVMNAATFVSCAAYGMARRKNISATTLALIGAGMFVLLCASFFDTVPLFLVLLFFAYSGYNIVCYAIPDIVYLHVEERIISAYHTWRMVFTTLGTIISAAFFGVLIDHVDGRILAAVGCAAILFCCISYFRVFKKS